MGTMPPVMPMVRTRTPESDYTSRLTFYVFLLVAERMIGKLVDDEVIPTAIVIKNIPFAVQKETLLAIIVSITLKKHNVDVAEVPLLPQYLGESPSSFTLCLQLPSRQWCLPRARLCQLPSPPRG